ncbi:MAG: hypothetical protein ACOYN3_05120 [Acidimicrobiia bacterium]
MSRLLRISVVASACLLGPALFGCSAARDVVDGALSAAMRTAASQALKQAAEQKGYPLQGDPKCSGSVQTATKSAALDCTATSESGLPVNADVKISNAGAANCTGTMTIRIGNEKPFAQDFRNCGA